MGFYNEKLGLFWVDLYRQVRERERERGRNSIVGHQEVWPDSEHKPKLDLIFIILHIVK